MERITITRGEPSTEEIAALTAVVAGLAAASTGRPTRQRTPAWGRAARIEATGEKPFNSAVDPRLAD